MACNNAAEAWEKEMDNYYQTLMAKLPKEGRNKLQAAQKAWIAFKEDNIKFINEYWSTFSGSMFVANSAFDRLFLNRQRALQLLSYYDKDALDQVNYLSSEDIQTEEEWDQLLNEYYWLLVERLDPKYEESLRAAQRKWMVFRDAEDECYRSCSRLPLQPDYRILLIQDRTLRLKSYIDEFDFY
jgi:uncharacterized protein YecT (DUF1311 family)